MITMDEWCARMKQRKQKREEEGDVAEWQRLGMRKYDLRGKCWFEWYSLGETLTYYEGVEEWRYRAPGTSSISVGVPSESDYPWAWPLQNGKKEEEQDVTEPSTTIAPESGAQDKDWWRNLVPEGIREPDGLEELPTRQIARWWIPGRVGDNLMSIYSHTKSLLLFDEDDGLRRVDGPPTRESHPSLFEPLPGGMDSPGLEVPSEASTEWWKPLVPEGIREPDELSGYYAHWGSPGGLLMIVHKVQATGVVFVSESSLKEAPWPPTRESHPTLFVPAEEERPVTEGDSSLFEPLVETLVMGGLEQAGAYYGIPRDITLGTFSSYNTTCKCGAPALELFTTFECSVCGKDGPKTWEERQTFYWGTGSMLGGEMVGMCATLSDDRDDRDLKIRGEIGARRDGEEWVYRVAVEPNPSWFHVGEGPTKEVALLDLKRKLGVE